MYAIGEFSQITGLAPSTLRYYESLGLLSPERDPSGKRRYDEADLNWVGFIRRLTATGMPLAQVQAYAELRRRGDETLQERLAMLETHRDALREQTRILEEHLANLDEKIRWYEARIGSLK